MSDLLSIGEFSKATYLTVKALRHYHELGLLEPVDVDPSTGYRRYATAQISRAQLVRRLRELDVPLDQVRTIVSGGDEAARVALSAHLDGMRERAAATARTVEALRSMLGRAPAESGVEWRDLPEAVVLAVEGEVAFDEGEAWLGPAFAELHRALAGLGCRAVGADGARWSDAVFAEGSGRASAFVPIDAPVRGLPVGGRVVLRVWGAGPAACTVHEGPFGDLDLAYGRLGSAVGRTGRGSAGVVEERYLGADRCEIAWRVAT